MTIQRATVCIVAFTAIAALVGGGVGALLGVVAPDYYRAVFSLDRPREAAPGAGPSERGLAKEEKVTPVPPSPVQLGFGLGLTQGLVAGALLGVVVVVTVSLRGTRPPAPG